MHFPRGTSRAAWAAQALRPGPLVQGLMAPGLMALGLMTLGGWDAGSRAFAQPPADRPPAGQPALPSPRAGQQPSAGPRLQLVRGDGGQLSIEVSGVPAAALRQPAEAVQGAFRVYVGEPESASSAMLGAGRVRGDRLIFLPRYPFQPGTRYTAQLDLAALGVVGRGTPWQQPFEIPRPQTEPTRLLQVYPSGDVLPENQLKFYLYFSGPMRRGDIYRHLHLRDVTTGQEVKWPFLEIEQELWDASGTRLTLLFDPGRVKRGLKPREEDGPILEEGHRYQLVVDAAWLDIHGKPLAEPGVKRFRAVAPDNDQPRPARWRITPPRRGSLAALEVQLDEPLDAAMLQRVLEVVAPGGQRVAGAPRVSDGENRWGWVPEEAWEPGRYRLRVETTLEDRAGNSIERPFEVDVIRPTERRVVRRFVELPFDIADQLP